MELSSYQDSYYMRHYIEYGARNNQNFGMSFSAKENQFANKEEQKDSLNVYEASIFYKVKLLQKKNFILSLQPKISFIQNSRNFYELSLLSGNAGKIRSMKIFTQNIITIGFYVNDIGPKETYLNVSTSNGIKFDNDIMLVNFVKYDIRDSVNSIYNSTIYDQLSIAKLIRFNNRKGNDFTIQIGYFWDKSLSNKQYKISGITFSLWLDL